MLCHVRRRQNFKPTHSLEHVGFIHLWLAGDLTWCKSKSIEFEYQLHTLLFYFS
jgi:hypothetical protein